MSKISFNLNPDNDRSLHGPGKYGYVISLTSLEAKESVEKELNFHEGHFHLERGGASTSSLFFNWYTKNYKSGDELLDKLKSKGLIKDWAEDRGMPNYKWSI